MSFARRELPRRIARLLRCRGFQSNNFSDGRPHGVHDQIQVVNTHYLEPAFWRRSPCVSRSGGAAVAFERIRDRIRDDADSRDAPQIAMHDYPDRAQFGEICGKEPREARIFVADAARRDADSDSCRHRRELNVRAVAEEHRTRASERLVEPAWRAQIADRSMTLETLAVVRDAVRGDIGARCVARHAELAKLAADGVS